MNKMARQQQLHDNFVLITKWLAKVLSLNLREGKPSREAWIGCSCELTVERESNPQRC
jgi:hypothetical protein